MQTRRRALRRFAVFLRIREAEREASGGFDIFGHFRRNFRVLVAELRRFVRYEENRRAHIVARIEENATGAVRRRERGVERVAVLLVPSDDAVSVFIEPQAAPGGDETGVPNGRLRFVFQHIANARRIRVFAKDASGRRLRNRFNVVIFAGEPNELAASASGERAEFFAVERAVFFRRGRVQDLRRKGTDEFVAETGFARNQHQLVNLLAVRALAGDFAGRDEIGADLFHQLFRFATHHRAAVEARVDVRAVSPTRVREHFHIVFAEFANDEFDSQLFRAVGGFLRTIVKGGDNIQADDFDALLLKKTRREQAVQTAGKKNDRFHRNLVFSPLERRARRLDRKRGAFEAASTAFRRPPLFSLLYAIFCGARPPPTLLFSRKRENGSRRGENSDERGKRKLANRNGTRRNATERGGTRRNEAERGE